MTALTRFRSRTTRFTLGLAVAGALLAAGAALASGHPHPAAVPQVVHQDHAPGGSLVLVGKVIPGASSPHAEGGAIAAPGAPASRAAAAPGGCGFVDISCQVDAWLSRLIVSAINPLLTLVGRTALSTPQVGGIPAVRAMSAGSLAVADTGFTLLLLAGGMILMGHQTYQTSYTIKQVAPRAVTGFVFANFSLLLISKAIDLANGITAALAQGVPPDSVTTALTQMLLNGEQGSGIFLNLLSGVAVVLAVVIAVTYIIRLMAVVLLAAVAPLALACYTLPHTEWAARWWWRAFIAALAIPAAQALVLTAAVKVFFSPGWAGWESDPQLVNILVTICLLYVIMRLPFWISRPALVGFGHSPIRSGLRFVFAAAVLSRARRVLRGAPTHAAVAGSSRRGGSGNHGPGRGGSGRSAASVTPVARAAAPVTRPRRSLPPGGTAAGGGAGGPGGPPSGPPPSPGGGPAAPAPPPLPDGGSGHTARHARPPSLPAGEDRPAQAPPLPAGDNRPSTTHPLPGGPARRGPVPPPPGGGTRRGPVPPLPGGPARRRPTPPLPGTGAGTRPTLVPPPPASPASPPGRTSPPPMPGGPARRGPVAPLPGGGRRRGPVPPLPGGPAHRTPAPRLPASRQPPAPPSGPLLSEAVRRTGRHRSPPPLPAGGTSQPARNAPPLPAPPKPTTPAPRGSNPHASRPAASAATQRPAKQAETGPARRRRARGRSGSSPRPEQRRKEHG